MEEINQNIGSMVNVPLIFTFALATVNIPHQSTEKVYQDLNGILPGNYSINSSESGSTLPVYVTENQQSGKELIEFASSLIKESKPLDSDIAKIVADNFWELI